MLAAVDVDPCLVGVLGVTGVVVVPPPVPM
jgi:hypothetical protein